MSALQPALRTRDGSFSVAAHQQMLEDAEARVPIDIAGALAWAKANGVQEQNGRLEVGRVNARRAELGLPLFRVTKGLVPAALPQEKPHATEVRPAALDDARRAAFAPPVPAVPSAADQAANLPLDPASPPIATTEDEFLGLVLAFDGTKTGLVTPEFAGWALKINTANRPMNHKSVEGFQKILRAGQWHLTGEPAIVSREGTLSDGQHRLEAIRRSGIPAPMDIRFGIERAAFVATGIGRRRTAAAIVAISGERYASAQAGIARLLIHHDAGQMARYSGQVEPELLLQVVRDTPTIRQVAEAIQRHRFAPARTAPFGVALVVAMRQHPEERVLAFAEEVNSGRSPTETSAAYQLHLRLRDAAMRKERIAQIDAAALTVFAFNAWTKGKEMSRLHLPDAARTNEGFPQVVAP